VDGWRAIVRERALRLVAGHCVAAVRSVAAGPGIALWRRYEVPGSWDFVAVGWVLCVRACTCPVWGGAVDSVALVVAVPGVVLVLPGLARGAPG
jgi:hypothetical protein